MSAGQCEWDGRPRWWQDREHRLCAEPARATGITPYAASKGGIMMLNRGICADLAASGIWVSALAPGYFAPELTKVLVDDEAFANWLEARTPAGRWGQDDELVDTLISLRSPASSFVHGQVVYVDGGMKAVV